MTKHSKKNEEEENVLFWGPFEKNIRKSEGSTKLRLSVISVKVNFARIFLDMEFVMKSQVLQNS